MQGAPSCSTTSYTSTTFGWWMRPAAWASRTKRRTARSFSVSRSHFSATRFPVVSFTAATTRPIPPRPTACSRRYFPATSVPGLGSRT